MPAPEVRLACARPGQFEPRAWDELARQLDAGERETVQRYRHDADKRSFIAAHTMLRALVSAQCGIAAHKLDLRHDARGRPFYAQAPHVHVSLSHSRDAAVCAVALAAPVGVDVEKIEAKPVDAGLLGAFVVAQEPVTARAFYFQWTALEAFWKACGTGLADGNARIACLASSAGRFDVFLERSMGTCAGRGAIVHAFEDCALAVVLRAPADPDFVVKRTNCGSAVDIQQLSRAHAAHERFFAA